MIEFKNYSFQYEGREESALKNINLSVEDGEFILITGKSGSGKTTLIRALNGLIPYFYLGKIEGELRLDGKSLIGINPTELVGTVGMIFQDPRSQFFMTDTTREIAFGCENIGMKSDEIINRIEKAVEDLGLTNFLNRSIFELSSGEKQQIAIGSVYALSPKIFIFDEPSANLDYESIKRLKKIMGDLKSMGYTIIVVEHRFYYLTSLIDKAYIMRNKTIERCLDNNSFCNIEEKDRITYGLRSVNPSEDIDHLTTSNEVFHKAEDRFEVSSINFSYCKKRKILENINFKAQSGDIVGIVGNNGAGKTTLISILTGILKEESGGVFYNGKKLSAKQRKKLSYLVLQDTDYQLFSNSVEDELLLGMNRGIEEKALDTMKELDILQYRNTHPAALSGGQKQRVTIGAAIVKESNVIYFDEPTSGLDYDSMVRVSKLMRKLSQKGKIMFVISHDYEFITRTCNKVLKL